MKPTKTKDSYISHYFRKKSSLFCFILIHLNIPCFEVECKLEHNIACKFFFVIRWIWGTLPTFLRPTKIVIFFQLDKKHIFLQSFKSSPSYIYYLMPASTPSHFFHFFLSRLFIASIHSIAISDSINIVWSVVFCLFGVSRFPVFIIYVFFFYFLQEVNYMFSFDSPLHIVRIFWFLS